MAKQADKHISETPATAALKALGIAYTEHPYAYVDRGGTAESARQLGVDEHAVIKTLVMQNEAAKPLIVLMHGDCSVSTKNLARDLGCKKVEPCTPETAQRHTGYQVGGTSPFGTKKRLPVYAEASLFELPAIYLNGGRRGYLVRIAPSDLQHLGVVQVRCALP
jgi:Cys-tRNA(Pro) deacylase